MWPSNQYTELSTNRSQFPNLTLSTFFQSINQYHYYKRIQYFFPLKTVYLNLYLANQLHLDILSFKTT